MRGRTGRRVPWRYPTPPAVVVGLVGLVGLVATSCGSSPSAPQAGTPTTNHTAAAPPPSTSTTSPPTPASTLPPVSTSGPLQPGAAIALPFSADRVTAAESPDGAVFAAPQDPTSPSPSVAWVVDGNGPAAIAEHVPTGIAALAADDTNFYVATYATVFAYDRASGNQDGQWTMPSVRAANSSDNGLVALAAAAGDVFVSVTRGDTVSVYRIEPASSSAPHLVLRGLGDAIGTDGSVYYESADHHLDVLRPNGATVTGPALAATPNGLGGGVQYLDVVAGGAVWVSEPAGQGLDATYTTYDVATLRVLGTYGGSVTSSVVDSAAGPLVLEAAGANAACPAVAQSPTGCVFRLDVHGTVSDPVGVGSAVNLLGPGPAVVVSDASTGQFDLVRLS